MSAARRRAYRNRRTGASRDIVRTLTFESKPVAAARGTATDRARSITRGDVNVNVFACQAGAWRLLSPHQAVQK
jgi:hypothetical protein